MLTFSIVINTTDRANSLHILLKSLEQQSYPHFEVLAIVGPTQDHTYEILEAYQGRVRVYSCSQANLSQSRNIGLAKATGDIVAYIDDDAVPSYHWLQQLEQLFASQNLDATGGIVYLIHPNQPSIQHRIGTISPLAEQHDIRPSWFEALSSEDVSRQWIPRMMGTNMAYRRQALLDIGGFDEYYEWVYDDADIALRLANAGKVIHPVLEAPVYHVPASSRNRKVYSYTGRWWIRTKAAIYFSFKNGRGLGHSWHDIALRSLHLVHGHWLWTGQLRRDRHITLQQLFYMRYQTVKSGIQGALAGSRPKRKLLQDIKETVNTPEDTFDTLFQPFMQQSSISPTIDPISGKQASLTLKKEPMRICLLSNLYPPHHYDGVGRLTNLMAQGLFELGHTVHVITRGERELVTFYDGAYVHQIPYQLNRYTHYQHLPRLYHTLNYSHAIYDKVRRLQLNDGIQIVDTAIWQVEGLVTLQSGILPVVTRLLTATRQIAELQHEQDEDTWLIGEMERTLLEESNHLLPNSVATAQVIDKVYGVQDAHQRTTIVPYGIVPVPEEAVRPFVPENPPETLTVLYLGRLEKRKGITALFDAIPDVVGKIQNVQFIIAGADNSQSDGFYSRTGQSYSDYFTHKYHRYTKYVTFLGGVSDEKLHELYQTCDLFVAPSLYESFGLVYLEAMNYAKPVIGCRAGGIPEVIDEGITGLLAEPDDSKSLTEAILTLLQSPQKLREMGLAGRNTLLAKFTHVQMARNFAEIYQKIIEQRTTN